MKITFYLDVTSSWCFWAQPAWEELRERFAGRVEFEWKIALLDAAALPPSAEHLAWYYRRSGTIMQSPVMLSTGWYKQGLTEYLAPNAVAEAAKDFGVTDDRTRLAIARAALLEGRPTWQIEECVNIGSSAASIDPGSLRARAESEDVISRLRKSTAEFHAHQINQRPAFIIEDRLADKAVFSGLAIAAPLASTIEAMLSDVAAYASHTAHFGAAP